MKGFIYFIIFFIIFFVAFLGSMAGMVLLIPFGLLVQESIILPITMLVSALPATLAAGWVGSAFRFNGQRTNLKAAVVAVEKTAVLLALFQFIDATFNMIRLSPTFLVALVSSMILASSAVIATGRHRQQDTTLRQDVKLTLQLLAIVPIVPIVVLFATWLGLTSA